MGELRGTQWNPRDIARVCYEVAPKWRQVDILTTAVMVCLSESQGFDKAVNWNHKRDKNGNFILDKSGNKIVDSEDHGPWQINTKVHRISVKDAQDFRKATKFAYGLWRGWGNFNAWYGFRNKVYLRDTYLRKATKGVGNFMAEFMLERQQNQIGDMYQSGLEIPLLDYRKGAVGESKLLSASG